MRKQVAEPKRPGSRILFSEAIDALALRIALPRALDLLSSLLAGQGCRHQGDQSSRTRIVPNRARCRLSRCPRPYVVSYYSCLVALRAVAAPERMGLLAGSCHHCRRAALRRLGARTSRDQLEP